ncbi:MAG TPA: DUF4139 domain-containing protein, partial [Burkholderiaceae bacterium]
DRAVYLVATAARPAGAWPAGPLQAFRDGRLVSRGDWQPAQGDGFEIALGQDERMRVDVEAPATFTSAKGLFDSREEKASSAVYAIVNGHGAPVTVQVLDAAPQPTDEAIQVRHTYDPAPETTAWQSRAGVAEWTLLVPPQGTRKVSVGHVVDYPKGRVVTNLP